MSSRRAHDTLPGASGKSHHDPYQRWIPPGQPESSRSRHRTTTSQPVNDARLGASRQVDQSRPHTSTRGYQSDTYVNSAVPVSSNHNQPSTSRGHRTGHAPPVHNSGNLQPQSQRSLNQAPQVPPGHYSQNAQSGPHQQRAPPDAYEPRRHLHRNTAAVPSPHSSVEKVSSTEDIARISRHPPLRSTHDSRTPAPSSTPAMWIPPSQEGQPSSRKQRNKETERETEDHMKRSREKSERRREKEREMLEKERAKEKERSREKRRANEQMLQERQSSVKPPSSTRYYQEPRVEDPDSSDSVVKRHAPVSTSRRRHRAEEGATSHPTSQLRQNESTNPGTSSVAMTRPANSAHATSTPLTSIPPSTSRAQTPSLGDALGQPRHVPPPTPRVIPLILPQKESKPHRSYRDRRTSIPAEALQSGLSGSETEQPNRKEHRHRTTNSTRAQPHRTVESSLQKQDIGSGSGPQTNHDEPVPFSSETNPRNYQVSSSSGRPSVPRSEVSTPQPKKPSDPRAETSLVTPTPVSIAERHKHGLHMTAASFNTETPSTGWAPSKHTRHDRSHSYDVPPRSLAATPRAQVPSSNVESRQSVPSFSQQPSTVPLQTSLRSTPYVMNTHDGSARSIEAVVQPVVAPVPPTSHSAAYKSAVPEHRPRVPLASAFTGVNTFRSSESSATGPHMQPNPSQVGSSHATVYHVTKASDVQLQGHSVEPKFAPITLARHNGVLEPIRPIAAAPPSAKVQPTEATVMEKQSIELANIVPTSVPSYVPSQSSLLSPSGLEVSSDQLKASVKKSSPLGILKDLHSPVTVTVFSASATVGPNPAKSFPVHQISAPVVDTASKPSYDLGTMFDERWTPPANVTLLDMRPKKVSPDTQTIGLTSQEPADPPFPVPAAGPKTKHRSLDVASRHLIGKQELPQLSDGPQHEARSPALPVTAPTLLTSPTKESGTDKFVEAKLTQPASISVPSVAVSVPREAPFRAHNVPQMHAPTPQPVYHNTSGRPASRLKIIDPRSPGPMLHTLPTASQNTPRDAEVTELKPPEHSAVGQLAHAIADLRNTPDDPKTHMIVPPSAISSKIPKHERKGHNNSHTTNLVEERVPEQHPTTQSSVVVLDSTLNTAHMNAPPSHASESQMMPQLYKAADTSRLSHHPISRFPIIEDALQRPPSTQPVVSFSGQNPSPRLPNIPSASNPLGPSYKQPPSMVPGSLPRSVSRVTQQDNLLPAETNHAPSTLPSNTPYESQTVRGSNLPSRVLDASSMESKYPPTADFKPPSGLKNVPRLSDLPALEDTTTQGVTTSLGIKSHVGSGSQGRHTLTQSYNVAPKEPEHPPTHITDFMSNSKDVMQSASSGYNTSRLATSTHGDGLPVSQHYVTPKQSVPPSVWPVSPVPPSSATPLSSQACDSIRLQPGTSEDSSSCRPVRETVATPQSPRTTPLAPALSSQGNNARPPIVTREASHAATQGTPCPISQSKPVQGNGSAPEHHNAKTESAPSVSVSTLPQPAASQPKTPAEVHNMRSTMPQNGHASDHVSQASPQVVGVMPQPTIHPRVDRVMSPPVQGPAPEPRGVSSHLKPINSDGLFPSTITAHPSFVAKSFPEHTSSSYLHPAPQLQSTKELGQPPSGQSSQTVFDSNIKPIKPSDSGSLKGPSTLTPTRNDQFKSTLASMLPNHITTSDDTNSHTRSRSDETQRQQHATPLAQQSSGLDPTPYPTSLAYTVTPSNAKSPRAHPSNYRTIAPIISTSTAHPLVVSASRPSQDVKGSPPIHPTPAPQVPGRTPSTVPSAPPATQSMPMPYSLASQSVPRTEPTSKIREMPTTSLSSTPLHQSQPHPHFHRPGPSTPHPVTSGPPTARTHHQHSVSLPTNYSTTPSASTGSRTHYTHRPGTTPVPITSPSSVPSDPSSVATSTRVPISGHLSTPAPPRAPHLPGSPSGESLLNTPSSIAPSLSQRPPSRASVQTSHGSPKKKGGFLSIFRSKTTAPKNHEIWYPPAETKTPESADSRSKKRSSSKPSDNSTYKHASSSLAKEKVATSSSFSPHVDAPIPRPWTATSTVTPPVPVPSSGRKSPGSKILSPFRLLSSHKRYRTVSAASLEALDGTATSPNTVMGSPTQSALSQTGLPPVPPPPMRDPLVAAKEWRNREEAESRARGKKKRRPPGVVFDVAEDVPKAQRHPSVAPSFLGPGPQGR